MGGQTCYGAARCHNVWFVIFAAHRFATGRYHKSISRRLRGELQSPRKIKPRGRQRRSVAFDYRRTFVFFVRPINRTGIGNWLRMETGTATAAPRTEFQIYRSGCFFARLPSTAVLLSFSAFFIYFFPYRIYAEKVDIRIPRISKGWRRYSEGMNNVSRLYRKRKEPREKCSPVFKAN